MSNQTYTEQDLLGLGNESYTEQDLLNISKRDSLEQKALNKDLDLRGKADLLDYTERGLGEAVAGIADMVGSPIDTASNALSLAQSVFDAKGNVIDEAGSTIGLDNLGYLNHLASSGLNTLQGYVEDVGDGYERGIYETQFTGDTVIDSIGRGLQNMGTFGDTVGDSIRTVTADTDEVRYEADEAIEASVSNYLKEGDSAPAAYVKALAENVEYTPETVMSVLPSLLFARKLPATYLTSIMNGNIDEARQVAEDTLGEKLTPQEENHAALLAGLAGVADFYGDRLLANNSAAKLLQQTLGKEVVQKALGARGAAVVGKVGGATGGAVAEGGGEALAAYLQAEANNTGEDFGAAWEDEQTRADTVTAAVQGTLGGAGIATAMQVPSATIKTAKGVTNIAKKGADTVASTYNNQFKNNDKLVTSYDKSATRQDAWEAEGVTKDVVDNYATATVNFEALVSSDTDRIDTLDPKVFDDISRDIGTFVNAAESALEAGNLSKKESSALKDMVTEAKKFQQGDLTSLRGKKGADLQAGLDSILSNWESAGVNDTEIQTNIKNEELNKQINEDVVNTSEYSQQLNLDLDEALSSYDTKTDYTKKEQTTESKEETETEEVTDFNEKISIQGKEYSFEQLELIDNTSNDNVLNAEKGTSKGTRIFVKGQKKPLVLSEKELTAVQSFLNKGKQQQDRVQKRVKNSEASKDTYRTLYKNLYTAFDQALRYNDKQMAMAAIRDINNIAKRTKGVENLDKVSSAFNDLAQESNARFAERQGNLRNFTSKSTPTGIASFRERVKRSIGTDLTNVIGLPTNTALSVAKPQTPIDETNGGYKSTVGIKKAAALVKGYFNNGEKAIVNEFGLDGDEARLVEEGAAQERMNEDIDIILNRALNDENTNSVAEQFKEAIISAYYAEVESFLDTLENETEASSAVREVINEYRNNKNPVDDKETVKVVQEPTDTYDTRVRNINNSLKGANPKVGFLSIDPEGKTAQTIHKAWDTLEGLRSIFAGKSDKESKPQTKAFFDFMVEVRSAVESSFNDVKTIKAGRTILNQGLANFFEPKYEVYHPLRQLLTQSADNKTNRLDNNMIAALSAAIINYVETASTYKTDEDLANQLGLNYVPEGQRLKALRELKDKGDYRTVVADSIGGQILNSLGLTFDKSESVAEHKDQMKTAIGTLALSIMEQKGLVKANTISAGQHAKLLSSITGEVHEAHTSKAEVVFIQIVTQPKNKFEKSQQIQDLVASVKYDDNTSLLDVFDFDNGIKGLNTRPSKDSISEYDEFGIKLPQSRVDEIAKLQNVKWRFDEDMLNYLLSEGGDLAIINETFANDYANPLESLEPEAIDAWLESNVTAAKRGDVRYSLEGKLEGIKRIKESVDYLSARGWDASKPVYLSYAIYKQGRFGPVSNGVNPQTDKLHRRLLTPVTPSKKVTAEKLKDRNFSSKLLFGISALLGVDEKTPMSRKLSIVEAIDFIVDNKKLNASMSNFVKEYTENSVIDTKQVENIVTSINSELKAQGLPELKLKGINAITVIQELHNLHRVRTNKTREYITNHVVEVDGITNGFAITLMQLPVLGNLTKHLNRVGLFNVGSKISDVSEYFGGNAKDSYEALIDSTYEAIPKVVQRVLEKTLTYDKDAKADGKNKPYNNFRQAVVKRWKLDNQGKDTPNSSELTNTATALIINATKGAIKEISRDLAKNPFMVFNYSASLNTIKSNVAYAVEKGFDDRLQELFTRKLSGESNSVLQAELDNMIADYRGIGIYLNGLTLDTLATYKPNKDAQDAMKTVLGEVIGTSMSMAIEESIGGLSSARDLLNQTAQLQYEIFIKQFNKRKAEIEAENKTNKPKGIPFTAQDADNLIEEMKPFIPSFKGYGAKDGESFPLFQLEKTTSKDGKVVVQVVFRKGKDVSDSATVSTQSKEIIAIGVGTGAATVQQIDAAIMTNIVKVLDDVAHVHDATKLLGTQAVEGATVLNKEFYEINRDYSILEDLLETFADKVELYNQANNVENFDMFEFTKELIDNKIQRGDNIGSFTYFEQIGSDNRAVSPKAMSKGERQAFVSGSAQFFLTSIRNTVDRVNEGRQEIFSQSWEVQQYPSLVPNAEGKSSGYSTKGDEVRLIEIPSIIKEILPTIEARAVETRTKIDNLPQYRYTKDKKYLDKALPKISSDKDKLAYVNKLNRLVQLAEKSIKAQTKAANKKSDAAGTIDALRKRRQQPRDILGSDLDVNIDDIKEFLLPDITNLDSKTLMETISKLEQFDTMTSELTPEHKEALMQVASSIVNNGLDYVEDINVKVSAGSQQKGSIHLGTNTVSISLNTESKLGMHTKSGLELLIHELVHSIVEPTNSSSDPAVRAEWLRISRIMDAIKDTYTKDELVDILAMYTEGNSRDEALKIIDYTLYNVSGYTSGNLQGSRSKAEFITYGLTNQPFMQMLKHIEVTDRGSQDTRNILEKLYDTVISFMSKFWYPISERNMSKNLTNDLDKELFKSVLSITEAVKDANKRSVNGLEDRLQSITDKINVAEEHVAARLAKMKEVTFGALKGTSLKGKQGDAIRKAAKKSVLAKFVSEGMSVEDANAKAEMLLSGATDSRAVRAALTSVGLGSESSVAKVVNNVLGDTDGKMINKMFRMFKNKVEHNSVVVESSISKSVLDSFNNALTKAQESGLTKMLLATDVRAIYKYLGDTTAFRKVLTDTSEQAKLVSALEEQLEAQLGEYTKPVMMQARGLAYQMVTGVPEINNQMLNVESILSGQAYYGADDKYAFKMRKDLKGVDRELLDTYISLKALQKGYNVDGIEAIRNDIANNNSKGISDLMTVMESYHTESKRDLFESSEYLMNKGHYASMYNKEHDFELKPLSSAKELAKQGYEQITGNLNSPMLQGYGLFIRRALGGSESVSGPLNSTLLHAKGTDVDSIVNANPNLGYQDSTVYRKQYKAKETKAAFEQQVLGKPAPKTPVGKAPVIPIPIVDGAGQIVNYRYVMSESQKQEYLSKDYRLSKVVGRSFAQNLRKVNSKGASSDMLDALEKDFEENYNDNPDNFVWVTDIPHANTEMLFSDEWRKTPPEIRERANSIFGGRGIPVRKNHVRTVFGGRKVSVTNSYAMEMLQGLFPDKPVTYWIGNAEQIVKEGVQIAKSDIVIKTPDVLINNVLSNTLSLIIRGVPPTTAFKDQLDAVRYLREYEVEEAKAVKFEKLALGESDINKRTDYEERALRIRTNLKNNPISDLVTEGLYQTIIEDVEMDKDGYLDAFRDWSIEKGGKGAEYAYTGFDWLYMNKRTPLYKFLAKSTQYSDFAARYSLIKNEKRKNAKRPEDKKLSNDVIIQDAVDMFINYDLPDGAGLEYMNDMGLLMFTKFFFGIQRVIHRLVTERALSTSTVVILQVVTTDVEEVIDSSMLLKDWGNLVYGPITVAETILTPEGLKLLKELLNL